MKVTQRFLLLPIAAVIFSSVVFMTGCSKGSSKSEVTELTFINMSSRKELTEMAVAAFNEANPDINITYVLTGVNDYTPNLKVAASSNSLPDFWFTWGGTIGSFYPENDLTYNLNDFAKKNGWDKKFSKAALDLSTYNGKLSGYPVSIAMIGMYYRKDIFEKCGVSVPKTFEEFEASMATIKKKGYIPLVVCGKPGWHLVRLLEVLLEMYAGAEMHDKLNKFEVSWNSEPVIQAFTKFKEFADKGYFPEGFVTLDGADAKSLLYSEKSAMTLEGPWAETNLFKDEQKHELYGYFKLPLSDKGNRMSGFVEMYQFNKNLDEKKFAAAMKFTDFLYSPESISNPKWGTLIKQPVPRNDNKIPDNLTLTKQMVADVGEYGSFVIFDQSLPQELVTKFFEAQSNVAIGSMTPQKAAEFMQTSVEDYQASKK